MISNVKKITDALEDRLQSIIPTFVKSLHTWSLPTGSPKAKYAYRIIPGQADITPKTMRTFDCNQEFTIFLDIHYKADNDVSLSSEIETLYLSLESVTTEAMKKGFSIGRIIQVTEPKLSPVEIDHDNKIVTIGATYSVLYRME